MVKLMLNLETTVTEEIQSVENSSENPSYVEAEVEPLKNDTDDREKFLQQLRDQFPVNLYADRDLLLIILHNQVATRDTLIKFEAMATQFGAGISPKEVLKAMMGRG